MEFSYWHMQEKNVLKTVNFVEKKLCTLHMASQIVTPYFYSYILICYWMIKRFIKSLQIHSWIYLRLHKHTHTHTHIHTHTRSLHTQNSKRISFETWYLFKYELPLLLCLYTVCHTPNLTKKVSIKYINA